MLLLGQRNIRRVKAQVVANSLSKNEVMLLKLMSEFHACTLMFLNNCKRKNNRRLVRVKCLCQTIRV